MSKPSIAFNPLAPAPPSRATTTGYLFNHIALLVTNQDAMLHFYTSILGMHRITTTTLADTYTITYLGFPREEEQIGEQQQQPETQQKMFEDLRQREGLLEFLHPHSVGWAEQERVGRFSHLGFVVPDVEAAEQRMETFGVKILKGLGVDAIEPGSSVAEWWGLDVARAVKVSADVKAMRFDRVLLVQDPDGNVVEIMEKE